MKMNGILHPRASVSRLYLQGDEEGRGLRSIEETIETEKYRLSDYEKETNKGHNSLLKSVKKGDTKKGIQGQHQETQKPKTGQRNHCMNNTLG